MLVKRVEVQGFKSFADRAVVEFGPGSIGIVGPNGAGKSNITDAIRWVLGEQNPRLLRSSRMEDIIFNGSETRKPLGFAEVVLTLDNQGGEVDIDYAEISVTRRLYRSGESEYLLNGAPARLKDLTDLLAGLGLGKEGYSLIGQGRIDEVLMSTPESRRGLFDEACGIGVHRGRKREALARLDDVAARLERVSDVTAELEAQLAPLGQQAEVAKAFVGYREELERLELWLESRALAKLRERSAAVRIRLDEARQKGVALRENLGRLEEQARTLRAAQSELGSLVEQKQQEAAMSEAALRQLSGRIQELQRAAADRRREAELVRGEQERLGERLSRAKARLEEIAAEKSGRAERQVASRAELVKAAEEETARRSELTALKVAADAAKTQLLEIASQASSVKFEISRNEAEVSRLGAEKARLARQAESGAQELSIVEAELASAAQRLEAVAPKVSSLTGELAGFQAAENSLGARLLELAEAAEKQRDTLADLGARRASLEAAIAAASAWSRTALAAVAAGRERAGGGLVGILGEELEVAASERAALEAALGRFASALIVATQDDLRRHLSYLRSEGLGPAVVVPLDLVEEHLSRRGPAAQEGPGRSLADLVKCPATLRPVVEYLLGETLLARDFEEAQSAVFAGKARRAVTRDGLLVRPGGAVSVAPPRRRETVAAGEAGLEAAGPGTSLETMRELREVRATLEKERKRLAALSAERAGAEKNLTEARQGGSKAAVEHRGLSLEAAALAARVEDLGRRRAAVLEAVEAARASLPDLGQAILTLEAGAKTLAESLREAARKEEDLRAGLAAGVKAAAASEEAVAAVSGRVGELRVLAATLGEQERAGQAEATRLGEEMTRLSSDETRLAERLAKLAQEAQAAEADVGPLRARFAAATSPGGQPRPGEDLEAWRSRRREMAANLEAIEAQLAVERKAVDEWTERERREETRLARLEAEDEMTARRLRRDFGDDWEPKASEAAAAGGAPPPEEAAAARVEELRLAIGRLGVVNIGAIEEQRRLSERSEFLKGQAADLTSARESLLELISEMDETMAARFEEAFFAVRRAFREKIPELFAGGRGDLVLTNRDDLLESGIEILVEPPSKKLQSLALLSAGERALSALGLLLSFLEVRPSPFVILDEIDAPLDDANVARFCAAVVKLAAFGKTQFVIVTHNKTTMEISEALYGVTMGDDGVSRLVSVKLEDREAFARRLTEEAG